MKKLIFFSIITIILFACSKKEEDEVVPTQNIDSISATILPNPTKGDVIVTLDEEYTQVKVEIRNVNGELVFSKLYKKVDEIELSIDAPLGLYLFEITHVSGVKRTYKVLKV